MNIVDTTKLAGKTFTAKSGNVCRFYAMKEKGGLHGIWKIKPSQEDMEEAKAFVGEQLGANVENAVSGSRAEGCFEKGEKMHQEWLEKQKGS
jgi:hypothetical protein